MQEIVHCPSCQRKLQVPLDLMGQSVQCPSCASTFVASTEQITSPINQQPAAPAPPPLPPPPAPMPDSGYPARDSDYRRDERRDEYDDYDDEPGYRRRRRSRRRRDLEPHRGGVILTLGILSLVFLAASGCFPLTLVLGGIAWFMGHEDRKKFAEGTIDPDGEGITNGGWICGMIGTILSVLFCLGCCGYFGLIFVVGIAGAAGGGP